MKTKHIIIALLTLSLFGYWSCKKNEATLVEDPHNHSLLNKTLPQLKAEIAGTWQMKRSHYEVCGILGCTVRDTTFLNNGGDLIYFLANDTVKRTGYMGTPFKIYQKAIVQRKKYYGTFPVDSIYTYEMFGGSTEWLMIEIKNDSLVIGDIVYTYYLTRR